jgi:hypothetical protein
MIPTGPRLPGSTHLPSHNLLKLSELAFGRGKLGSELVDFVFYDGGVDGAAGGGRSGALVAERVGGELSVQDVLLTVTRWM